MSNFEKDKLVFYQCEICGNLIIKLEDSGITPQCCSHTMTVVTPSIDDKLEEKHVPVWRMNGCKLMVQVGETLHPATADHHINWIVIKTNMGLYLRKFAHDELPEATVTLARGECVKEIFSFCNIHGLWLAGEEESL